MLHSTAPLLAFYRQEAPDDQGRFLVEIQAWDHRMLEYVHDYIQWLFPLRETSGANPDAPTLDDAQIREFRGDPVLQARVLRSLEVMLDFYGFRLEDGRVRRAEAWEERKRNWVRPGSHNYLRITRILKFLRLAGLEEPARAFYQALEEIYLSDEEGPAIGDHTFEFWTQVMCE